MKKQGQVWIADATLSIMLFTAAAVVGIAIILNSFDTQNDYEKMKSDASKISEYFLSEGTPLDWNETNVIRPGVMSGKRLNHTKLYRAMNISNSSYSSIRPSLQTKYDFIIILETPSGQMMNFQEYCSFGIPETAIERNASLECIGVNLSDVSYNNLVRINRYAVYNSSIVRVVTYLWD